MIRRLSALPSRGETFREYAEYVEFPAAKRKDYHPLAVLQYDDDLRNFLLYEECALNDFHSFSNLMQQHFHLGTLSANEMGFRNGRGGRGGRNARGMSFRERGVSSRGPQTPNNPQIAPYYVPHQSHFPCFAWFNDNCPNPAAECDYSHIFGMCNLSGHTWSSCEKRRQPHRQNGRGANQKANGF